MNPAYAFLLVVAFIALAFVLTIFSVVGGALFLAWCLINAVADAGRKIKLQTVKLFRK